MLKNVLTPNSVLIGEIFFKEGWNSGACKKQILAFSNDLLIFSILFVNV